MHWRSMFDAKYIGAWDLPTDGKDVVVTIDRVEAALLEVPGTPQKKRKPVVYMRGAQKGFALNKTNAKAIAGMYGNDTAKWIGRRIAIYATRTQFGDETVDCIRVRPRIPGNKVLDPQPQPLPPEPQDDSPFTAGDDANVPEDPDAGP